MNEIKSVAIYCRVSTEEQTSEGYSIAAQLQTLRQYATLYGWQNAEEYVDEGISGKDIKSRPAMQRLITDVDKDKFQAVLVWKISRLSRNMLDTFGYDSIEKELVVNPKEAEIVQLILLYMQKVRVLKI